MALRILAGFYLLGQDRGFPETNIYSWNLADPRNRHVDVQDNHKVYNTISYHRLGSDPIRRLIRSIGAASIVLLKNKGSLPLQKPCSIAIVGSDAAVNPDGPNSCADRGCNVVSRGGAS